MAFFCPICGAPEASRERRPNGNSKCRDGHPYASVAAIDEPTKRYVVLQHVPESQRKYARMVGNEWVVGAEPGAADSIQMPGSSYALDIPASPATLGKEGNDAFSRIITGLGEALLNVDGQIGPLAIAVSNHHLVDQLADIFRSVKGPYDQGIAVIPFGASPLSYCPRGALLFRALVVVPPREGPLAHNTFMAWADSAFSPYLSPNAKVVTL